MKARLDHRIVAEVQFPALVRQMRDAAVLRNLRRAIPKFRFFDAAFELHFVVMLTCSPSNFTGLASRMSLAVSPLNSFLFPHAMEQRQKAAIAEATSAGPLFRRDI